MGTERAARRAAISASRNVAAQGPSVSIPTGSVGEWGGAPNALRWERAGGLGPKAGGGGEAPLPPFPKHLLGDSRRIPSPQRRGDPPRQKRVSCERVS